MMLYDTYSRDPLYRSRRGFLAGVCRGVADYLGISVFWMRAALVIAVLVIGFWPTCIAYVVAALLMRRAPIGRTPLWCAPTSETCNRDAVGSRGAGETLDVRMQRMQATMDAGAMADWDARLRGRM